MNSRCCNNWALSCCRHGFVTLCLESVIVSFRTTSLKQATT